MIYDNMDSLQDNKISYETPDFTNVTFEPKEDTSNHNQLEEEFKKTREENIEKEAILKIFLHPSTLRRLRGPDSKLIDRMERNYGLKLTFEAAETYHVENFKLIDESTSNEIR